MVETCYAFTKLLHVTSGKTKKPCFPYSYLGKAAGQILIDGIWSEVISISPFISLQMSEVKESSEGR